jgi:hypothetical protein
MVPVGEQGRETLAQRIEASPGVEPEDGAQDHLQGQPLETRIELDSPRLVPARDLPLGHRRDQVSQPLHSLSVESGGHQLPLLHVSVLVEEDHRVGPDQRLQHPRTLARVEHVCGGCEDLPHLVGLGDRHERRGKREPDREPLPVALPTALKVGERAAPESDPLDQRGGGRTRRKAWLHRAPIGR